MSPIRRVLALALLAAPLVACSTATVSRAEMTDPALITIHEAFAATVEKANNDPDVTWKSGWFGNVGIHLGGREERGLCYEWQGLVYGGVLAAVRSVGWDATGVSINRRTSSEHHAVVVYDPKRVPRDRLLGVAADDPAYVLDAWQRGEADVYRLADWLTMPFLVRVAPRLEEPYPGR